MVLGRIFNNLIGIFIITQPNLYAYDKFTLFQYFSQRPFSRKNMHFILLSKMHSNEAILFFL